MAGKCPIETRMKGVAILELDKSRCLHHPYLLISLSLPLWNQEIFSGWGCFSFFNLSTISLATIFSQLPPSIMTLHTFPPEVHRVPQMLVRNQSSSPGTRGVIRVRLIIKPTVTSPSKQVTTPSSGSSSPSLSKYDLFTWLSRSSVVRKGKAGRGWAQQVKIRLCLSRYNQASLVYFIYYSNRNEEKCLAPCLSSKHGK